MTWLVGERSLYNLLVDIPTGMAIPLAWMAWDWRAGVLVGALSVANWVQGFFNGWEAHP